MKKKFNEAMGGYKDFEGFRNDDTKGRSVDDTWGFKREEDDCK